MVLGRDRSGICPLFYAVRRHDNTDWLLFASEAKALFASGLVQQRDLQPQAPLRVLSPGHFQLVGIHWRGPGIVKFRTRDPGGRWSRWRESSDEDNPPHRGWRIGEAVWVGASIS